MTAPVSPTPLLPQPPAPDEHAISHWLQDFTRYITAEFTSYAARLNGILPKDGSEPPTAPARRATYTVAGLPSASAWTSARAFVSDATVAAFGTVPIGGGSTVVPVYSDGTNWRIGG
jgi:hypothetical protein